MRNKLFLPVLLMMLLTGCTHAGSEIVLEETESVASLEAATNEAEPSEAEPLEILVAENIVVYVCGAVVSPGVYELPEGSRIDDAVKAASGFSDEADRSYVNLAARVSDGMKLQIPTAEETKEQGVSSKALSFDENMAGGDMSFASDGASGLININTASKEELKSLPGIGDSIAGKIIKYREENGSFKKKDDIMKVSGIKDKLFSKIKDHITV